MIPSSEQFRAVVAEQFAFLVDPEGFEPAVFAETGGDFRATFEDRGLAIVIECGRRESDVWTLLKNLERDRQVGLDTFHSLHAVEPDYPPFMGAPWESLEELRQRLALEGSILRANLPAIRDGAATFEELGSPLTVESADLSDPVATFTKRCTERLGFLVHELGLRQEIQNDSEVLYLGLDRAVRVTLLWTAYEHEDEAQPTLCAELVPIVAREGELAPHHGDAVELEIGERPGPFTPAYLDEAFDQLEADLRSIEPQLRRRSRA